MIKNIHGNTLDWLGAAILSGRYPAGGSLPSESMLSELLGVSRTVVREAVKSLVAKGIVITGPKLGTRVLHPNEWNWFDPVVISWLANDCLSAEFLQELQELRRVVEPAAVRFAAERATSLDIENITQAYDGMVLAVEKGGDYISHDLKFHQGLLAASRNRMLLQMGKILGALLQTSFEISTSIKGGPKSSLSMHKEVLDAVIAHDSKRAETAILKLIDSARDDIALVISGRRHLSKKDSFVIKI